MCSQPVEFVNAALLSDLFGHWPSFHDAEIRAVRLSSPSVGPASLELDIDVAERSNEVDQRGIYKVRQRGLVTFRFERVAEASLVGFGLQNVLADLQLTESSEAERARVGELWSAGRLRVRCVPCPAFCEIDFTCETAAVLAVRPIALVQDDALPPAAT